LNGLRRRCATGQQGYLNKKVNEKCTELPRIVCFHGSSSRYCDIGPFLPGQAA
jgi:hypothetical protein